MKLIDYFLRTTTIAAIVVAVISPNKWGFAAILFNLAAIGIWALLYPQGVMEWARTAHPQIDPADASRWWVPRFIGGGILVMVLLIMLAFNWR